MSFATCTQFSCKICYSPSALPCYMLSRLFISKQLEGRSIKTSKCCRHIALHFVAKMSKAWKLRHNVVLNFISTQIFVYDKFQLFWWQEAPLLNCWNTWNAILRHWHMHRSCCPYDRDECAFEYYIIHRVFYLSNWCTTRFSKRMLKFTWEVLLHVLGFHNHHQRATICALLKL